MVTPTRARSWKRRRRPRRTWTPPRLCSTPLLVGFQYRDDAERFQRGLSERLAKFRLELQPTKTRLIAFGKLAHSWRRARGRGGKPETFTFLGLTHICGRSRGGKFLLRRQTERKRM